MPKINFTPNEPFDSEEYNNCGCVKYKKVKITYNQILDDYADDGEVDDSILTVQLVKRCMKLESIIASEAEDDREITIHHLRSRLQDAESAMQCLKAAMVAIASSLGMDAPASLKETVAAVESLVRRHQISKGEIEEDQCGTCKGEGFAKINECTCGGTDIGVGVMHEHSCGQEQCSTCGGSGKPRQG